MRYKSFIAAALLGTSLVAAPGCQDDFADTNTNQSAITKADVRYLFTQVLSEFEPSKYQQWFYNNLAYTLRWTQANVPDAGNTSSLNLMGAYEGSQSQVINVKLYTEEIKYTLSLMSEEERATYDNIVAMCNPLLVYLGIFGTDMYGSMAYSEAGKALHEEILTPAFETQESLFSTWLTQLDEAIEVLTSDRPGQVKLDNQDFVYKGDTKLWAKFANSLKLKIAVRMLHTDKARALKIAEEVVKSKAGYMKSLEDDFFYCKGAQEYHFGDDVLDGQGKGIGSKQLIEFLVNNKDPRVRFIFQKNDFNSMVVQAFLDQKVELPPYIKEVAEIKDNKFEGWKAPGEPWVRYFGSPIQTSARENAELNNAYFNYDKFKLKTAKGGNRQYYPLARMNREMLQGQKDYTFPDAPDVSARIDDQDRGWYGLHFSAAEVHLYLAELKLLGANLPGSAESYYKDAITLSVQEYDKLASLNHIPYYSDVHDKDFEKPINLEAGEIDALLEQDAYKLTGSVKEQLEKVYIQQYIHFLLFPQDQFAQVRRSGVPMRGSKVLAWQNFTDDDSYFPIPRRWTINVPLESDLMYGIKKAAYEAQGFTTGTQDPGTLNTERVWYDKGAPNFGEGPNL